MTTPDDLLRRFMLALCIWREARGESPLGKAMVAQTIKNRADDVKNRWPKSIVSVILQPLQFSSFNANDPNAAKFPSEGDTAWGECVNAADRVLMALTPLTTANHYLTVELFQSPRRPKWADPTKVIATENHHVFLEL